MVTAGAVVVGLVVAVAVAVIVVVVVVVAAKQQYKHKVIGFSCAFSLHKYHMNALLTLEMRFNIQIQFAIRSDPTKQEMLSTQIR